MTKCRLRSPYIAFSIPGKVISQGGNLHKQARGGKEKFKNIFKLALKTAMSQAKWEFSDKAPIYIVLTVYLLPETSPYSQWQYMPDREKKKACKDVVCCRAPYLPAIQTYIIQAMKGVLIKTQTQIVAFNAIKKYDAYEEGIDILIGRPNNVKELINDLRNS